MDKSEFNLCVDQGNSSTKIGIFKGDQLVDSFVFNLFDKNEVFNLKSKYSLNSCILSSVVENDDEFLTFMKSSFERFILLDHLTPVPIKNEYETPATLGKDRLAVVVGASYLKEGCDVLVIDAGTAITYDFIDSEKIYHGGNIAPGIDMRLKSLNVFTNKLPLVKAVQGTSFLGKNTNDAILSGVMDGILFEIKGYITALKLKYPELLTFLTGGSSFYFETQLKSAIFAEKNLVLIGLNRILQFNVQK